MNRTCSASWTKKSPSLWPVCVCMGGGGRGLGSWQQLMQASLIRLWQLSQFLLFNFIRCLICKKIPFSNPKLLNWFPHKRLQAVCIYNANLGRYGMVGPHTRESIERAENIAVLVWGHSPAYFRISGFRIQISAQKGGVCTTREWVYRQLSLFIRSSFLRDNGVSFILRDSERENGTNNECMMKKFNCIFTYKCGEHLKRINLPPPSL